jgi:NAD(P)-dependent dehydrogenase (short-subunit alcohol dehydrogenase family)
LLANISTVMQEEQSDESRRQQSHHFRRHLRHRSGHCLARRAIRGECRNCRSRSRSACRRAGETASWHDGNQRRRRDSAAVAEFFRNTGAFDHLVLSISIGGGAGPFAKLDIQGLKKPIDGKLLAQLSAAQLSLGTLAADGSITFVTAASARAAFPGTVGLAAINGALNAAAATLTLELKSRQVNVVSPGIVETPIWSHFPEEQRRNLLEREAQALPVGRIGQPGEVAQAIVMLMGNGFMTGAIIDCDGGARVK